MVNGEITASAGMLWINVNNNLEAVHVLARIKQNCAGHGIANKK